MTYWNLEVGMAEDRGIWIYAVAPTVRREWFGAADGVGGRPVWPVFAAGLAAAVSGVDAAEFGPEAVEARLARLDHHEDRAWVSQTARRHHAVIEKIAAHQPVVPMRLGTLCPDEVAVASWLTERHDELAAMLTRSADLTPDLVQAG